MALDIVINGVHREAKCQDGLLVGGRRLNYNRVSGSPATLTLYTFDKTGGAGGYRPAIDETVAIGDGVTTFFSGVITDIREESLSDVGLDKGILCAVTCTDKNGLTLRDTYTKEYADGTTVKQVLQDLIANPLSGRGITLDGAQANGAALTGFKFVDAYIDDILNSLTSITGWPWDITPAGVLSMISPASVSCGFSLTDGGGNLFGGVTAEQGRSENYANRVTVIAGPAAQLLKTETITGNGSLDHWVLTYTPMVGPDGFILSRGLVTENGVDKTLSQPGGGGNYTWTAATNTLTRAAGALPNGQVSTLIYAVQFPISVTVNDSGEQAAHGIYARKFIAEDITDIATATQIANGLITSKIATPKTVRIQHRKGLAQIGRSVTVTISERNLNATFMIVGVSFWNEVDGNLTYSLDVISGTSLQDSWVDYFKRNGSGAGASSSPSSISGAIIPGLSGLFEGDVRANTGLDNVSKGFESALTNYANSAGAGPALQLGRVDRNYAWILTADSDHGSTPGAVGKLRFHPFRRGSNIECAMSLAEPDTGGTDDFIVLPGLNANLYLGDYAALMSGLSPSDSRIEGILCANIMATAGYFELGRTTRLGQWIPVSFSAGNFTASGSQTWTVASGDQVTYAYTLIYKTMILSVALNTTTVGGTPDTELRVAIPGSFTAAKEMRGSYYYIDNGTRENGSWSVAASGAVVKLFTKSAGNWTGSTDNTYVSLTAAFEVN